MPEILTQSPTESPSLHRLDRPAPATDPRSDDPPRPGNPFEERPAGTTTSNETSTQDSGSGG